jgi:hypothetical protein
MLQSKIIDRQSLMLFNPRAPDRQTILRTPDKVHQNAASRTAPHNLLGHSVIMMSKLVHENVQQHKRPRLRCRKAHRDKFARFIKRNAQPLKDFAVRVKIRWLPCHP